MPKYTLIYPNIKLVYTLYAPYIQLIYTLYTPYLHLTYTLYTPYRHLIYTFGPINRLTDGQPNKPRHRSWIQIQILFECFLECNVNVNSPQFEFSMNVTWMFGENLVNVRWMSSECECPVNVAESFLKAFWRWRWIGFMRATSSIKRKFLEIWILGTVLSDQIGSYVYLNGTKGK